MRPQHPSTRAERPSPPTAGAASAAPTRAAPAAFADDLVRHLPDVARFARHLARSGAADADDLVQESYLCALRHWRTFAPGTNARRWLFTICKRCFLRACAESRRGTPLDDAALASAARVAPPWQVVAVDGVLTHPDLGPAVHAAIAALPGAFRDVALLVDVRGYSYDDAARRLGIPLNTLRTRLWRARRRLRPALAAHASDAGFGPTPGGCGG